MAIKLENKTNVDAPSTDYPYGKIRDNPGDNSGTPLNEMVHQDYVQFFARLLHYGESSLWMTANGLPENQTNGFQYVDQALAIFIREMNANAVAMLATSIVGGVYPAPLVPFGMVGLKNNITSIDSGVIFYNGELLICTGFSGTISDTAVFRRTAELILTIYDDVSGSGIFDYGDISFITPYNAILTNPNAIIRKVINIGDWNMASSDNISVAHGITDWTKIRNVHVMILTDTGTSLTPAGFGAASAMFPLNITTFGTGLTHGSFGINSTNINLARLIGGIFDAATFDATSYNRGYITIEYAQ